MATPESVLALTQPTIMMTEQGAMDSGIGELMQGIAGDVEMSGPMDDGVGSLMAAGAGNTPPVNFRNGGPVEVRGFSNGTPAAGNSSVIAQAQAMAPDYQKYFAGAMDSEARAADLEEQKRMSQAQMLFDIAGAGLAFAGETQGGTAAERLANALTRTQLTDKIGSRSAGILDAKRAQAAEDRQLRMASLQGALGQAQIDEKARQDLLLKEAGSSALKPVSLSPGSQLVSSDGTVLATNSTTTPKTITLSAGQSVFDEEGVEIASMPSKPITYNLSPGEAAYDEEGKLIVERANKPQVINLAPGAIAYDVNGIEIARGAEKPAVTHLLGKNQKLVSSDGTVIAEGTVTKETVTLGPGQQVVDVTDGSVIAKGPAKFETISLFKVVEAKDGTKKLEKQSINVATEEGIEKAEKLMNDGYLSDSDEANAFINQQIAIQAEKREEVGEQKRWERNRDAKLKDVEAAITAKIAEEERQLGRDLNAEERAQITWTTRNTITDQQDLNRLAISQGLKDASQISKEERAAITAQNNFERDLEAKLNEELRAIENGATIELREVDGQLVKVDTLTGETSVLFGEADIPDRLMAQITLPNKDGVSIPIVIDINSPEGQDMLEQVNAANAVTPGSAGYQKVSTASTAVRGFFVEGEGVVTSFDGKTFINSKGEAENLANPNKPKRSFYEVAPSVAYDVYKNEKLSSSALQRLDEMDVKLVQGMTTIDGKALSKEQMSGVRDAYAAARIGTGFWSKVRAGIDAVAGGVISPEFFGDLFKETQDARQFIRMLRVMGRSALAASPRFAVADLQTTEQLFPNEQILFSDPVSEANKLKLLSNALTAEKRRILGQFATGIPMDSSMKGQLNQKLFEIGRLEEMLGPINLIGEASGTSEAVNNAVETMRKARQAAKDNEGEGPS